MTLVEYGDYECPYCRAAAPIVRTPSTSWATGSDSPSGTSRSPHPPSRPSSGRGSGDRGHPGQVLEDTQLPFSSTRTRSTTSDLVRYAFELDLDAARFRRELVTHAYAHRVAEDFQSGLDSGVEGTPTFFLDGVQYDGPMGVRELLAAIREAHPEIVDADVGAEGGAAEDSPCGLADARVSKGRLGDRLCHLGQLSIQSVRHNRGESLDRATTNSTARFLWEPSDKVDSGPRSSSCKGRQRSSTFAPPEEYRFSHAPRAVASPCASCGTAM